MGGGTLVCICSAVCSGKADHLGGGGDLKAQVVEAQKEAMESMGGGRD